MRTNYTLDNPPSLNEPGYVIDQQFLRHIKTGEIPELAKYLERLNPDDWTGLLAHNPREEFIEHLKDEMVPQLKWKFILGCVLGYKKCYL